MPITPNIPNEGGAFTLAPGSPQTLDPTLQWSNPSPMRGVGNLIPEIQGRQGSLPNWKFSWNMPGPLKILCIGDSLVKGFPVATVPWSHRLHQWFMNMTALADGGIGLMLPSWAGDAGSGVTVTGNPPIASGTQAGAAGYGVANTARSIGALGVSSFTFNTNNVTWCTGTKNVQTIDILYVDVGAFGGDIQYKIDGGAAQTLTTAKLLDKVVKTVRIPAGAAPAGLTNAVHSVEIGSTGNTVAFVGIICYSGTSGASGVMVHNAGVGGCTALQYTTLEPGGAPNSDPLSFIGVIAPHLTIMCLGTNDTIQTVPSTQAQLSAAYDRIINTLAFAQSDLLVISPPPYSANLLSLFPQKGIKLADVEQTLWSKAQANNLPMLNMRALTGEWSVYGAGSLSGDNVIHFSDAGNKFVAGIVKNILWQS